MAKDTSDKNRWRREVIELLSNNSGIPEGKLEDAPTLSSADVSALFRMSERNVRLWAAKGTLPYMHTLDGARILYPDGKFVALYAKHHMVSAKYRVGFVEDNKGIMKFSKP